MHFCLDQEALLVLVAVGRSSRLNPRLNALAAVGSVSVDTASTDGGSTALILGAVGMYIAVLAVQAVHQ